jgi:hypothetical protein
MNSATLRLVLMSASLAVPSMATINVTLTPSLPSPQPLGTSIHWTAAVSDTQPGGHVFRFKTQPTDQPAQIRRDFAESNEWTWTPAGYEDTVRIVVIVVNIATGASGFATANYSITSRLNGGAAAVNPTGHPLVALFSAPPCLISNSMRIRFRQTGQTSSATTHAIRCRVDPSSPAPNMKSMNFYVGGMYASSTYLMNWETVSPTGAIIATGSPYQFTTGAIPPSVAFPAFTVPLPPPPGEQAQPILLSADGGDNYNAVATDLTGRPVWYYAVPGISPDRTWFGGNMLVRDGGVLREIDLAGNILNETNARRVSTQLVASGYTPITTFHHEARRIFAPGRPVDGYIVVLGYTSLVSTQFQGGTPSNPVEILSDSVIVLDRDMQLAWAWNPFIHLDLSRPAVFDDKCTASTFCKPIQLAIANDWTHANSIQYTPWDGNLIVSLRHQDWVIKINFADGAGSGDVIWRMGRDGDFTVTTAGTATSADVGFPWFSYQHDAEFELFGRQFGGRRVMTIFDNGNTRRARYNASANSRCQSFAVDEANRTVNLNINADVGVYSSSQGNAQLLTNGNLHCDAAAIQGPGGATMQSSENDKSGNLVYVIRASRPSYRTFRMESMSIPVTP